MSDTQPSISNPEPLVLPNTVHKVLHEPSHWHHHNMTEIISATPAVLPHPTHHHHHHDSNSNARPNLSYAIRPGVVTDLGAIHKIYTYYVLNSAISLLVHAPGVDYLRKGYDASTARNLPYLIAVSTTASVTPANAINSANGSDQRSTSSADVPRVDDSVTSSVTEEAEVLMGYIHVVPLSEKAGYGPTVELTMYVHPSYLGFGIGSALLSALEAELRKRPILVFEPGFEDKGEPRFADVILSRVGDDVEKDFDGVRMNDGGDWPVWKAQREKNTQWYLRKGFEEVGRMKKVGEKFGKR